MKFLKDKNVLIIIGSCVLTYILYVCSEYYFTDGKLGVPLDDSWIHFRFAENLAKGLIYQFNVGEPTSGTTSPLWVIFLAGFSFISSNYIFNSVFLSALFHILSCIFIYKLSLYILDNIYKVENAKIYTWIITILTILTGRFAWAGLSGMETTMFAFFSIAGFYVYIRDSFEGKRNLLPALLFAVAAESRPEGYLLFCLFFFDTVLNAYKENKIRKSIPYLAGSAVIFAVITLPYLIFSYKTSGHFFPNTFRGQGGGELYSPNLKYLQVTAVFFLRDNPVTAILYFAGLIYYIANIKKYFTEFRYINLIFLWIYALPLVSSVLIPNWRHHGRYLIPIIHIVNFASVFIFIKLKDAVKEESLKKIFRLRYFKIVPALSLVYFTVFAYNLGMNTDNINDQQVKLADWVKENVPQNEVIALNDIGAITFKSNNRIIDMAGLVTPEILRYRTYNWEDNLDSTYHLLKSNNVKYMIIYDSWFTEFMKKYGDRFQYVTSAILENNTICGGDTMKVYKANLY